ncbi:hypothetical protein RJD39_03480 [Vibrio scophthalmi]|uniref:hypothetical protein n=1 Tax=Vibrio scophthalmi TaxID=45658 RepID=UPI003872B8C1
MKLFTLDDLSYKGEHQGVHRWDHPQGDNPYYWHPEWLHVAEDALGLHPKQPIDVPDGENASPQHAEKAILDHLNGR